LKKLAFLGGAAGLGLLALLNAPLTQAADHADVAALAATNPMADINDVYAWMTSDGANINLALTVSPFDDGNNKFSESVQYVFHIDRYPAFPASAQQIAAGQESKVVCTFESDTSGECWVIDPAGKTLDYVKGDFSAESGVTSAGGTLKAFAGRRSDPFFFNLAGFTKAVTGIVTACGGSCPGNLATVPGVTHAGCPKLPEAATSPYVLDLRTTQPTAVGKCPANQKDCFALANVMALVIQVDKTLIATDASHILGIWASTHAGQ